MKVAITGCTGQLGGDIVEVFQQTAGFEPAALPHEEMEICDLENVRAALGRLRPEAVINSAAFHQVDKCEENPEEAFRVNAIGAWNLARACQEIGVYCVYISTDYVFDGAKGSAYVETDTPHPLNVYGASKLAGEHLTRAACPAALVARVASVIGKRGARGKGGNFIEAILKKAKAGENLKVVADTRMTPTYTRDAARALAEIVRRKPAGIAHLTNAGPCSWHEFAKAAVEMCGLKVKVEPTSSDAYPSKVRRPVDSSLRSETLGSVLAEPMRPWQDALRDYLIEKGHI